MAITDTLTGLNNRREIERIIENIGKQNKSFSLIMLDADNFKQINDTYGHKEGDKALCFLADSILNTIKETGLEIYPSRWGGDEFLMVCVSDDEGDALRFAKALQSSYHSTEAYPGISRTVSIGIVNVKDGKGLEEAFQNADDRLYDAKANGKARIEY